MLLFLHKILVQNSIYNYNCIYRLYIKFCSNTLMIIKSIPEINMYSMLSNIWKIYEGSIICVIENIEQVLRYWCNLQRGVRQGCVTSGFLFIIVIDWMLRSTSSAPDQRRTRYTMDIYMYAHSGEPRLCRRPYV